MPEDVKMPIGVGIAIVIAWAFWASVVILIAIYCPLSVSITPIMIASVMTFFLVLEWKDIARHAAEEMRNQIPTFDDFTD